MLTIKIDGATSRIAVEGHEHVIPTEKLLSAVEAFLMDGEIIEGDPRPHFLSSVRHMEFRTDNVSGSTKIGHRLPA